MTHERADRGSDGPRRPASDPSPTVPNHHADRPGPTGVLGLLAGLTMVVGRGPDARLAARTADLTARDRLVDVGCGPGSAAREAARRGATVTGVDPSLGMLALARRLTGRASSVRWVLGSAETLPLPDGCATVVWSLASVHHWRDVDAGLAETRRVLTPGGRLVVIERHVRDGATGLSSHGWTPAQAEAFAGRCRAAGLRDVKVVRSAERGRNRLVVRASAPGD